MVQEFKSLSTVDKRLKDFSPFILLPSDFILLPFYPEPVEGHILISSTISSKPASVLTLGS